mgnify:CR=1 FL=1
MILSCFSKATVVFLEAKRSGPVVVVVVLLSGSDTFSDILAFDLGLELGEDTEPLKECVLIRIVVAGA